MYLKITTFYNIKILNYLPDIFHIQVKHLCEYFFFEIKCETKIIKEMFPVLIHRQDFIVS